jgi:hypothetical protein
MSLETTQHSFHQQLRKGKQETTMKHTGLRLFPEISLLLLLVLSPWGPVLGKARETPQAGSATGTTREALTTLVPSPQWPQALRIADFLLSLQTADGAIPDEPGVITVNQDSNMEYALIGVGAAYAVTKNPKYLTGLENGIKWLAAREEMTDARWKGSWRYVYSAVPPFLPISTSPGPGLTDARGVDATSTLFVYLLYLDQKLTGSSVLAQTYAPNARAALDFVIHHNLDTDGFSWSSWQLSASDGKWHLYQFKYSADQGDVFLGMQAGAILYDAAKYGPIAHFLKQQTPVKFFSAVEQRFGLGLDEKGVLVTSVYIFPQGYLPWMWGHGSQNQAAQRWLQSQVRQDGSIVAKSREAAESLSVAVLGMANAALKLPQPRESFDWMMTRSYDPKTGGVRDTADAKSSEYDNVAGFCVLGLLGFLPFD